MWLSCTLFCAAGRKEWENRSCLGSRVAARLRRVHKARRWPEIPLERLYFPDKFDFISHAQSNLERSPPFPSQVSTWPCQSPCAFMHLPTALGSLRRDWDTETLGWGRGKQLEVSTWRGTFRAEITPIAFVKEMALAPLILKGVNSTTLLYTYLE